MRDVETLTRLSDRFTPMTPNAAIGLVLDGGALALWAGRPTGRGAATSTTAAGGLLVLLGLVTLAQFAFGLRAGIDRLLPAERR